MSGDQSAAAALLRSPSQTVKMSETFTCADKPLTPPEPSFLWPNATLASQAPLISRSNFSTCRESLAVVTTWQDMAGGDEHVPIIEGTVMI